MKKYNIIGEKWIPVRMLDGSYIALGIGDLFIRAKEIAAIEDPSPLVVASIHRFLLALLYRALEGPTDNDQAKTLFMEGFPNKKIELYLEKWKDRFWLFDEKYPFGQIPSFKPKSSRAWTTLTAEHNADNAKVLFDHVNVLKAGKVTEAKAICAILATQTFVLGGGNSDLVYTCDAPSATAMMVFPLGENLEETLIFSLVPENREIFKFDLPIWEREPESVEILNSRNERGLNGFADLYTWRSRAIRLEESFEGGVESLGFASGMKCKSLNVIDPMLAYRIDDKLGRLPIRFKERGLWRDFDCMLPDSLKLAPLVIEHAAWLSRFDPKRLPKSVMVVGQSNTKATVDFWRMECFALPKALAKEKFIRSNIRNLLNIAESNQKILWESCKIFAVNLLSRGNRNIDKEDIRNFIKQMPCIQLYWSALEAKFYQTLSLFFSESGFDEFEDKIEHEWLINIDDALTNAWNQHKSSVSLGDIWGIRALSKAENTFYSRLSVIKKTIKEYELKEIK